MYCKRLKGILSVNCCILRQERAEDHKKQFGSPTSFKKCYNCSIGMSIKRNPSEYIHYDHDIRRLIREYEGKPNRLKLKVRTSRLTLKVRVRLQLKIKELK